MDAIKPHHWSLVTIDGGHVGTADIFICRYCGATGSFGDDIAFFRGILSQESAGLPFLADGHSIQLPDDCDEAKEIVVGKHGEAWIVEHNKMKYIP